MIRKIAFCGILLATLSAGHLTAQCIPDSTLKNPGYRPDSLPHAMSGVAYAETISIRTPRDTSAEFMGNTVTARVDSIKATGVKGMPPGFTYACQHPRCVFLWDTTRCVEILGTTNQPGTYPLKIAVTYYALLAGTFKVAYPDTIYKFTLVVDGSSSVMDNSRPNIMLFPNPASGKIYISGATASAANAIRIYGSKGDLQNATVALENGVWVVDLSSLADGIYLVRTKYGTRQFQVAH